MTQTSRRAVIAGGLASVVPTLLRAQATTDLLGPWHGQLPDGPHIRLDIRAGGQAELIDLNNDGFPVMGRVTPGAAGRLAFAFSIAMSANPNAVFDAAPDGPGRLVGTWNQGPFHVPLTLQRGNPPGWTDWAIYDSPPAPMTRERLATYRRTFGVPAITAGARKAGRTQVWSIGERRVGSGVPVSDQDQWRIGSMTKSMTATVIARAIEEGALTWDYTLGELLGEVIPAMHPGYRSVTLRHLLTHHAGLVNDLPPPALARFGLASPDPRHERRAYAEQALAIPPLAPPGARFSYSSAGYIVAAAVLEVRRGQSWEYLMGHYLFEPLGLSSAGFGSPGRAGAIEQPFGHRLGPNGHAPEPRAGGLFDIPAVVGPAGGVHISIPDLLAYLATHCERHPFLNEDTWSILHTPPFGGAYAMGWGVTPDGLLTHNGATSLWLGEMAFQPSTGVCSASITNVNGAIRATMRARQDAATAMG